MIKPIDGESESYLSYVVLNKKTGIPEKPEMRLDLDDPNNKTYLKPYVNDKILTVQIRETHKFCSIDSELAMGIAKENKECLYRFLDDYDSVTFQSNETFCEIIEWDEANPEESTSDGYYSFYMDRILSLEEQNGILLGIGFKLEEIG